jgi:hypothetical protein
VFDTAAQGVQAACEMQQGIDALPAPAAGSKLALRIGIHAGPVLLDEHDVFGDTVNTAARLTGLAKAGQIFIAAEIVALLPPVLQNACREMATFSVKGKAAGIRVCEVIWQASAELTMMSTRMLTPARAIARLELQHGQQRLLLDASHPVATLGRDPASDIVIRDPRASRSHAQIECRHDKFVLVDLSSNGTYVSFQGECELALKREELILRGSGQMVFGHPAASQGQPAGTAEIVQFAVLS